MWALVHHTRQITSTVNKGQMASLALNTWLVSPFGIAAPSLIPSSFGHLLALRLLRLPPTYPGLNFLLQCWISDLLETGIEGVPSVFHAELVSNFTLAADTSEEVDEEDPPL